MSLKIGKFYRSRGGEQVRIYATDGLGNFPVHGAVRRKEQWVVRAWTLDGLFFNDGETTEDDIVGEWKEPKPPKYYPFNDEQLNDCIGSRVVQKDNGLSRQIGFEVGHGVVHVLGANLNVTAFDLLEYFTWADGTPCGVLVTTGSCVGAAVGDGTADNAEVFQGDDWISRAVWERPL